MEEINQSKGIGKQLIEMVKMKYDKLTLAVYEKNIQAINLIYCFCDIDWEKSRSFF